MNTIEQQLWDYIDGLLNETQRKSIEEKIKNEPLVKLQYEELLKLNVAFEVMDLDEPSMSFTRNVMESVALEPVPIALKTKVNPLIICSIATFFVLSISSILVYVFYNSTLSLPEFSNPFSTNMNIEKIITPTALYIFLGVDLIIGLIFMDFLLRKKLRIKD